MDNVVEIHKAKNPDKVLEQAKGQLESVFIMGWDKEGYLDFRASTNINKKDILWMIELFKHKLLNDEIYEGEDE